MATLRRRHLLAVLGSGATCGCLSSGTDDGENEDGPTDDGGDSSGESGAGCAQPLDEVTLADEVDPAPPGSGFPALSTDGDAVPGDHASGLDVTVGVVQQYATDAVARVQIDLANRGETPASVSFGPTPPFSSYENVAQGDDGATVYVVQNESDDAGIVPVDGEGNDAQSGPIDGCWKADGVGYNSIASECTIDAGQVVSDRYAVYADAENDGCLPAGEYRFEETWTGTVDGSSFELDWGFALHVDDT